MDELCQIDLLIGSSLTAGFRHIAQRHGQRGDLLDHGLGQAHEVAQRGTNDVVQSDQDGERDKGPQAAGHGIHTLTGVELRHLLLLLFLVVGIPGLDILDLALHTVHAEHALLALELEGQQHQLHQQGEQDQRHAVGPGPCVEQAGQPRERYADVVSELCKHG